ncbi:MAG: HD domain-containing protein [Candidatus Poribacteria bacterium]
MKKNTNGKLCVDFKELRAKFLNHIAQRFDGRSWKKIHRALEVAEYAHAGQTRDDDTPYILHPLRIALFLLHEKLDIHDVDILCAALLHDVAEDQERFTPDYIEAEFGTRVSSIVRTLTKPDEPTKTREEINEVYFERLRHSDEDCKLIKLADKLDNVLDAVNCPYPAKQRRTAAEAKDFYLSLAASLRDKKRKQIILKFMNEAITTLEARISEEKD